MGLNADAAAASVAAAASTAPGLRGCARRVRAYAFGGGDGGVARSLGGVREGGGAAGARKTSGFSGARTASMYSL